MKLTENVPQKSNLLLQRGLFLGGNPSNWSSVVKHLYISFKPEIGPEFNAATI